MIDDITEWERKEGVKFLKEIGIKFGQIVLDFGARSGHYSIPAAQIVGSSGQVYALDKEPGELKDLSRKAKHFNLNNIKIIPTNGGVTLDFKSESIDVVLLYDVLHYLEKKEREKLYRETYHVLKGDGFLSVYPKHVIEDSPLNHFRDLHWEEVKKEIQDLNFKFREKYCDTISHDDSFNYGCVINFVKE
jgi:ubiquinone/menaquinone biosynthesis C-methylase UbiE